MADALEQLCGGSTVVVPAIEQFSLPALPDEQSVHDLDEVGPS